MNGGPLKLSPQAEAILYKISDRMTDQMTAYYHNVKEGVEEKLEALKEKRRSKNFTNIKHELEGAMQYEAVRDQVDLISGRTPLAQGSTGKNEIWKHHLTAIIAFCADPKLPEDLFPEMREGEPLREELDKKLKELTPTYAEQNKEQKGKGGWGFLGKR